MTFHLILADDKGLQTYLPASQLVTDSKTFFYMVSPRYHGNQSVQDFQRNTYV